MKAAQEMIDSGILNAHIESNTLHYLSKLGFIHLKSQEPIRYSFSSSLFHIVIELKGRRTM